MKAWPQCLSLIGRLADCYLPSVEAAAAQLNLGAEWHLFLAAPVFEPDPLSVERLQVRSPYTNPQHVTRQLTKLAQAGFFAPAPEGGYRLTPSGSRALQDIYQTAYAAMAAFQPLPAEKMERLAELLERVVTACLAAPEPPGKWCIQHSLRSVSGQPVSVRIDQHLTDISAYRDDAHLAAWRPYGVSGPAWDALTCLWQAAADTPAAIQQRLARRGFAASDYAAALGDLSALGWVETDGSTWLITELGARMRSEAEERTDTYFSAPWGCLSSAESDELARLLDEIQEDP